MRKSTHAIYIAVASLLASVALCIGSAFAAALAFGAVALIVPGTGTHNIVGPDAVTGYKENAADRYINPSGVPCTSTNGCDLEGIPYPATFFPLVIFPGWCPDLSCDTWNESVGEGVANLDSAVTEQLETAAPGEPIIVFGYSQGGAVVSQEMYNLANLDQATKDRISVVTIGNINNPQGLWSRLSFLPTIPLIDLTFGPQLPTDIGIKSTNYSFEYDPVGDAPRYWGNPLAVLNALAAFEYVHGYYLDPNSNGPEDTMPYGYTDATLAQAIADAPKRTYQDATFVLIPQQGTLPLFQPFSDLGKSTGASFLVDPVIKLLNPVTKLFVDLGYDREINPGIPQPLSPLPFNPLAINPVQFSAEVGAALNRGVRDALGQIPTPESTPAPDADAESTVEQRSTAVQQTEAAVAATATARKTTTPAVTPAAPAERTATSAETLKVVKPYTDASEVRSTVRKPAVRDEGTASDAPVHSDVDAPAAERRSGGERGGVTAGGVTTADRDTSQGGKGQAA